MAEPIFVPDTQCNYDVTSLPHHSALLSGIRACLRANTERDAVSSACKAMKTGAGESLRETTSTHRTPGS